MNEVNTYPCDICGEPVEVVDGPKVGYYCSGICQTIAWADKELTDANGTVAPAKPDKWIGNTEIRYSDDGSVDEVCVHERTRTGT